MHDALVIGAGPAGSMAAIQLASRGRDVLLVDRFDFPRDKVCGDGLLPDALGCLRRAGVYEAAVEAGCGANEIAIFSPSQIEFRVPGELLTLKRVVLDELLRRQAVARGASFELAKISRIAVAGDHVVAEAAEPGKRYRARFAVVATGANVSLLQPLGMVARTKPSAGAIRCYVRSKLALRELVVSFDRSIIPGYAWIFPVGRDEYNVGCGLPYSYRHGSSAKIQALFDAFVANFPLARRLFAEKQSVSPMKGHALRYGLTGTRSVAHRRILAVGESIGATFPLTGEGIGKAMETAEKAASLIDDALRSGDPSGLEDYPTWLTDRLRPKYLAYEIAQRWQSHLWLNDFLARRARKSAFLQKALAGILNETSDPRQIFSFRGIARSFFA